MIRKQIIFKVSEDTEIGYNYQHEVQKNIYKYLKVANEKRATMLHNKGYRLESGHIFKLFNYTLLFEKAKFNESNILLREETTIRLILSGKKENIKLILSGLLEEKTLEVGNAKLELVGVQADKRVDFNEVMLYKALAPIITTTKDDKGNKVYLTPYHELYFKNIAENLKRKYKAVYGKEYKGELFFEVDDLLEMRDKFIKIKKGGVKGHTYNIWVQADKDMQRVIYHMGLGQNSSIGCGCLSFITGVRANETNV